MQCKVPRKNNNLVRNSPKYTNGFISKWVYSFTYKRFFFLVILMNSSLISLKARSKFDPVFFALCSCHVKVNNVETVF